MDTAILVSLVKKNAINIVVNDAIIRQVNPFATLLVRDSLFCFDMIDRFIRV